MLVFSVCLVCAGAVLSGFARLPLLVAVIVLTAAAAALPFFLSLYGFAVPAPMPLAIVVAVVALQGGYGMGVIAKALWLSSFRDPARRTDVPPRPEEEIS
ncbi:MAG: hypothetical protein K2Y56_10920 [Methylobacterium sp.]|uniref:hypothetical protein n=1 Tax=Methylobacterium sp. TaxID=409 RepID=UPI0025FEA069|nr:hypothetical protein [Methylobacterium sp.]MBX9932033.1 hypothetical protein [Methylobacterium sp.]